MQDFEFSRTFFQLWEACNSARRAAIDPLIAELNHHQVAVLSVSKAGLA